MIIYTKNDCQPCQEVKAWLSARNIEYEERDILNRDHAREYRGFSSPGVPFVVTDLKDKKDKKIAFVGYRTDLLELIYKKTNELEKVKENDINAI